MFSSRVLARLCPPTPLRSPLSYRIHLIHRPKRTKSWSSRSFQVVSQEKPGSKNKSRSIYPLVHLSPLLYAKMIRRNEKLYGPDYDVLQINSVMFHDGGRGAVYKPACAPKTPGRPRGLVNRAPTSEIVTQLKGQKALLRPIYSLIYQLTLKLIENLSFRELMPISYHNLTSLYSSCISYMPGLTRSPPSIAISQTDKLPCFRDYDYARCVRSIW